MNTSNALSLLPWAIEFVEAERETYVYSYTNYFTGKIDDAEVAQTVREMDEWLVKAKVVVA